MGQLDPFCCLTRCIDHSVAIVEEMLAETIHCRLDECNKLILFRVCGIENIVCYFVEK